VKGDLIDVVGKKVRVLGVNATLQPPLATCVPLSASASRPATHDETKPSFKTTELFTMIGIVVAILIAAAAADNFDAPRAWTLVAVVASAYMVARGLAKSGSRHLDSDR
jgi:hypothetical protein